MTNPSIIKKRPAPGTPLAASGLSDAFNRVVRAIETIEVVGDDKIDASIEWINGIPRIKIKWKGP